MCSLSFARHLSILKTAIQAAPRPRKGIIPPDLRVVPNINFTSARHSGHRAKRRRSYVSPITRKTKPRTSQEPGQAAAAEFSAGGRGCERTLRFALHGFRVLYLWRSETRRCAPCHRLRIWLCQLAEAEGAC